MSSPEGPLRGEFVVHIPVMCIPVMCNNIRPLCATTGAVGFDVQKTADFPQLQLNNKVVYIPVMTQRLIPVVQTVWMTTEIPQLLLDKVVDLPVLLVVRVPQVQVVMLTVVISQLHLVEKVAAFPDL